MQLLEAPIVTDQTPSESGTVDLPASILEAIKDNAPNFVHFGNDATARGKSLNTRYAPEGFVFKSVKTDQGDYEILGSYAPEHAELLLKARKGKAKAANGSIA